MCGSGQPRKPYKEEDGISVPAWVNAKPKHTPKNHSRQVKSVSAAVRILCKLLLFIGLDHSLIADRFNRLNKALFSFRRAPFPVCLHHRSFLFVVSVCRVDMRNLFKSLRHAQGATSRSGHSLNMKLDHTLGRCPCGQG